MVDAQERVDKFPYKVATSRIWAYQETFMNELDEIRLWLLLNVGMPYDDWVTALGKGDCLEVRFARESDAAWFALKWG